ncbi:prolipoprotein diacylglyceryl transferase [Reyranella sp. CPCC 100927]|uniref:prolipoprotein diacylglyceryl transferase n=1 Tax=Reyranella sp. CPCC 100927 TaxID=2599616 RepID=UPI0011B4E64B|nr:prolipoprotein diacylglyceryl transferase [Reyranella sp. CPCC 100927]TWT03183.1 prolipoprotein diacylglyceryl transferase [Reyranella sp. CPCC 100927]
MSPLVIPYPAIDPVLYEIGPFAIRWYALAYVAGLVFAWWLARRVVAQPPVVMKPEQIDDFLFYAALGVILGGRLGYILFYKPGFYLANPDQLLAIWKGGMSFHGGLLGVSLAVVWYARRHKIEFFSFADVMGLATPIGLMLGRIANFINGELWGRASDVAWAMVFPHDEKQVARHPSQLYQAFLEGLVLFIVLVVLWKVFGLRRRPGFLCGAFWAGYGVARITGEFFREPDAQLGYLYGGWLTMGMLLSLPLIALGVWLMMRALRRPPVAATA